MSSENQPTSRTQNGGVRWRAWVVVASLLAIATLLLVSTTERLVVQKLLVQLVMPTGLVWLMLTGLFISACIAGSRRWAFACCVVWLFFWATGNPIVSEVLMGTLERDFATQVPLQMEPFDTLVVLGGGTGTSPAMSPQFAMSGDRVGLAAQMYHAGKVRRIVVTGKQFQSVPTPDADPSYEAKVLLTRLGVPADVVQEVGGRNTFEEMQNLSQVVGDRKRVGLITSAWHMPRALARSQGVGLEFVPVPADFATDVEPVSILDILPSRRGLVDMDRATKEFLGRWMGR